MKEKKRTLCVKENNGTLDIWINYDGNVPKLKNGKLHIITTFDGKKPEEELSTGMGLGNFNDKEIEERLNWFMGYFCRDTQNWFYKDLVIHWGVHTLTFHNKRNVNEVEKDEYTQTLEDIQMNYDVEW